MNIGQTNSLSSIPHSAWIYLFQGLFHCWKHPSNSVTGLCKSCCFVLSWAISTSSHHLTFSAFLIQGGRVTMFVKKLSSGAAHWTKSWGYRHVMSICSAVSSRGTNYCWHTSFMPKPLVEMPLFEPKEIHSSSATSLMISIKGKVPLWARSALQPYRLIVLWPPKQFLHSSLEALHTKRRERPQLAKEGTIDGI
jgi:hypothetical protein